MRTQITKRFNINLTQKEERALEFLTKEYANRNWKGNQSDIIREAIVSYCKECTGIDINKFSNIYP